MTGPVDTYAASARTSRNRFFVIGGVALAVALIGLAWLDVRFGWLAWVFDFISHQFGEIPVLGKLRRPTQIPLFRRHLAVVSILVTLGLIVAPRLDRHGQWWWSVFVVAYAIRATAWIVGGNLPLVPGDSPHYIEVAASILKGEGPVKHYVESFFRDYPAIRDGKGVLDDWATPLYAYTLATAYRITGVVPGESLEATVAVDKAVSFTLNWLCLPALYGFARRRFDREVALVAMALLAVLPVHAIYAGLDLRESLVALTSILAVWFLTEVWASRGPKAWAWAVAAGVAGGAAVLARNTAMALLAASGIYGLIVHRRATGPMLVWGAVVVAVIAPWAWVTYRIYGEPFYTYTRHFQYLFSWTVHHYQSGIPRASDFYTWANAPEIARVKVKSLFIIAGYSTMILGLPVVLAFFRRVIRRDRQDVDRLVAFTALVFVAATLTNIADVTQVAQLGRYYLPVFVLMLPTAAAGFIDWRREGLIPSKAVPIVAATLIALLWSDPTWAYDASWYTRPYQQHWPALQASGKWIKSHPEQVPPNARIMTWFPWEFRLASGRTTILLPRNFSPSRIAAVIDQYQVTHVLWGSFETPASLDPEVFGPFLTSVRKAVGLSDSREIYRSPGDQPFGVTLYRLRRKRAMTRADSPSPTRTRWAVAGLFVILIFNTCWRWHTIGPTPLDPLFQGPALRSGETEPLDCDEAAYAYMGRRIVHGDVLYRDLSENKPPLGYWLYTMAVALGGANEFTIRVMPIPFVLATIALVWWIALKLGGPASACLAAIVFAVADTDPYVFGNGSNMEHFINFFSVASLALVVLSLTRSSRWVLLGAGICLGLAALVKQVAVTHGLVYAMVLMWPQRRVPGPVKTAGQGGPPHELPYSLGRLIDVGILGLGFLVPCLICVGVLLVQGAGQAAYDDVVRFAHALVTDVPSDPNAPTRLVRWITGNADPRGLLPWPFGRSTDLVWWGSGLWPLWLASVPATIRLLVSRQANRSHRLLAAWTISAWVQVSLPGLFWQHYYMLAVPGAALTVSLWLTDSLAHLRTRPICNAIAAVSLLAALGWSGRIQIRDYANRSPNEITSRFKGGAQWVELREFGRELGKRSVIWDDPHLFVWGWQSPLFIYSGLDGVSREFFANELLRTHANDNHPIVAPRLEAILRDLRARPPALVLCGYPPFPALRRFLNERYLPSGLTQSAPDGRGLWVEHERYGQFETVSRRRGN